MRPNVCNLSTIDEGALSCDGGCNGATVGLIDRPAPVVLRHQISSHIHLLNVFGSCPVVLPATRAKV